MVVLVYVGVAADLGEPTTVTTHVYSPSHTAGEGAHGEGQGLHIRLPRAPQGAVWSVSLFLGEGGGERGWVG